MKNKRTLIARGFIASITLASCARDIRNIASESAAPTDEYLDFDLVPRAYDDNDLPLNPELGFSFNQLCSKDKSKKPARHLLDPSRCSWRFRNNGGHPTPTRRLCNKIPLDVDFPSGGLLSDLGITCSDSPLSFPGHLNWDAAYGGAVTYDGWISWEGYSNPKRDEDGDYNFVLQMKSDHALSRIPGFVALQYVGVELDTKEITYQQGWWLELYRQIQKDEWSVGDFVGVKRSVVTGLLGIDAEHMAPRDLHVELHPAYLVAIEVQGDEPSEAQLPTYGERWALLMRARGDEGFCSGRGKHLHELIPRKGSYAIRVPWKPGMAQVCVEERTRFFAQASQSVKIAVSNKPHQGVLVTVQMPLTEVVQGDLYLRWTPIIGPQLPLDVPNAPGARPQPELRGAHQTDPLVRAVIDDPATSSEFDKAIDESAGTGQSVGWRGSECVSPGQKPGEATGESTEEKLPLVPDRKIVSCSVPERLSEQESTASVAVVSTPVAEKPAVKEIPQRRTPREIFCDRPPATQQAQQFCAESTR